MRKPRNTTFLTLCIMGAFAILSSTMSKSPVLNPFAASLGTPIDWLGVVPAASTIPGILISLPAASLSDVYGRKRFMLISGIVFASAPFLYLLITVWWQLILVRFYHGFATGIFVPVAEAAIAEMFPNQRGERISLFTSTTYIGRVLAPTLGGSILLLTDKNFHILYLSVAVAGVTALIMALPFLAKTKSDITPPQDRVETVRRMLHGWSDIIRNRGALAVSFVQGCQYWVYGSFEFFLVGYLTDVVHFNLLFPGIIDTGIIGVAIFAKPYMGRLSDRIGRRTPIILGCAVSAAPLLLIPYVSDFAALLLLAIIYGLGFATVTSSTSALATELVPKQLIGTSTGFLATVMDIGQTIGPIICGIILAMGFQYFGVFFSLAFVLLFSCVAFALFGVTTKSHSG